MLQTVHTKRGRHHKDQDHAHRGNDLIFLIIQNIDDHIKSIILCIYPKQPEYPDHTEHSEGNRPHGKYNRKIIGKKCQKINQSIKGKNKGQNCRNKKVKRTADKIPAVSDLNNIKYFFLYFRYGHCLSVLMISIYGSFPYRMPPIQKSSQQAANCPIRFLFFLCSFCIYPAYT